MSNLIATFFGVGRLPFAPGTWGSLAALIIGWAAERYVGVWLLIVLTGLAILAGFWSCNRELSDKPGEDPSEIVIDEVAGMWIALLFPAIAFAMRDMSMVWPGPVAAFLFFRLFDIRKPWLVGRADRRHDPIGVMLDDIWAGIFAGFATMAAAALYHMVLI
ncbi:phosphatidylglycerophosphatase A [Shimia sp. R11_0]|uniref:Phosphatidylglycerophosphatase A n=1 Tax=Shimia marina TaxID=321267 RepID=A0A0P1ET33_9RHOB|nr:MULTISPECIES: phosphatidylglycerophosphatase A [Shimia]MBO9476885.1 phosphatidylglycerophosphatase A [Shimia sp. R11_0]CUH53551.1 Phosphatidylglycerophosphatase A [Shimia marina]SFD74487.1 phosphatidylglycerophosphatase A [Shimia marina]